MSDTDAGPEYYVQRPKMEYQLHEMINEEYNHIHIFGEPGVGKTQLLKSIRQLSGDGYIIDIIRTGHHDGIEQAFGKLARVIYKNLPEEVTEENRSLSGFSVGAGISGGVSWEKEAPKASRPMLSYRDIIRDYVDFYANNQRHLVCIDDVHKIDDNREAVRDFLKETAELLTEQITLISSGRINYEHLDKTIHIDKFSKSQTAKLLQNDFTHLSTEQIENVHDQLDGHPLYLNLLIEANDGDGTPDIPKRDIQNEIRRKYLDSLSREQKRFLRITSPLPLLTTQTCAWVLPSGTSFDRTSIDDMLYELNKQVVVERAELEYINVEPSIIEEPKTNITESGFFVHDTLRDFLKERMDPQMKKIVKERSNIMGRCEHEVHWYLDYSFMYEKKGGIVERLHERVQESTDLPEEYQVSMGDLEDLFDIFVKIYEPIYF